MGIEENKRRMHLCWCGSGEGIDWVVEEWIGVAFFGGVLGFRMPETYIFVEISLWIM